jgi:hypothetical protein
MLGQRSIETTIQMDLAYLARELVEEKESAQQTECA